MSSAGIKCTDWPGPLPSWVTVERARPERLVNLSQLTPAEKQTAWQAIRSRQPALAALLQDPSLQALREAFDADIYIDTSTTIPDYLQKIIEEAHSETQ